MNQNERDDVLIPCLLSFDFMVLPSPPAPLPRCGRGEGGGKVELLVKMK